MREKIKKIAKEKRLFSSLLAVLIVLFFTLYVVLFINTQSRDDRSRAANTQSVE